MQLGTVGLEEPRMARVELIHSVPVLPIEGVALFLTVEEAKMLLDALGQAPWRIERSELYIRLKDGMKELL